MKNPLVLPVVPRFDIVIDFYLTERFFGVMQMEFEDDIEVRAFQTAGQCTPLDHFYWLMSSYCSRKSHFRVSKTLYHGSQAWCYFMGRTNSYGRASSVEEAESSRHHLG